VLPELIAIGGVLILMWLGIGIALVHERHAAEAAAQQATGNLARAFEESTRRTISQIDQILLSARSFFAAQGERFDFDEWARTQTLPDKMTAAIGMADSSGHVFADTLPIPPGVTIADRPHFQAQIDSGRDELYISHPMHGRVSGQDTIQFTRKLLGLDRQFAGVTVLSLGCEELSRFYQTIDLGKGFVALLAADGTLLARGPMVASMIGQNYTTRPMGVDIVSQRSGVIRLHAGQPHLEQIVSFRRVRDAPLIVMVGHDLDTVLQQYRSLRNSVTGGGLLVTIAISLIGWLWVKQTLRGIASRRALSVTLETISQGIMMVDEQSHAPVINARAMDLLGRPDDASESPLDFAVSRAIELAACGVAELPRRRPKNAMDVFNSARQSSRFESTRDDGTIIEVLTHPLREGGFVQTYTDVTEQRLADAQVRFLAHHDTLTGLANRVQLRQLMPLLLEQSALTQHLIAFMIVDLDSFKSINDTLGHDAGDQLLIEIATRLRALVREGDLVARVGGDEFVIVQPGLRSHDGAIALAQRVLERLAEPAQIGLHQVRIGASIGIAFHPPDGQDGDALFKNADIALYRAKADGRGMFRCFDIQMVHAMNERRLLETDLRRALQDGELEVHYQPKFASDTLEIVGFEALARWRHPTRGYVSPDVFIRLAEECGLINGLGLWIIDRACSTAATWHPARPVAVNVSFLQLRDRQLLADIADILRRTGLPIEMLEIEVTESVMADDNRSALETLDELKQMGIRIALDDFGTGYSSLSYLRRFAFDKIKIDKSFVQGQATERGVRVILEAILDMCRNLGLAVVAEGVETQQQLELLRDNGCHELQGYMLGRPMPADGIAAALRRSGRDQEQVSAAGATLARHATQQHEAELAI
jgi:diguanylate cyclase (GGDEF)-like protein